MSDNRLGKWGETPQFPARTISGREYTRPVTTLDIGDGFFVVIDLRPTVDVGAEIEAIRASLKPARKAKPAPVEQEVTPDESEADRS